MAACDGVDRERFAVPYTIGLEFQRLRIMGKLSEILTLAQQRAKAMGLPYEGALTPQEAFDLLRLAPGARLVDVRTRAEWDWVGAFPARSRSSGTSTRAAGGTPISPPN
jgi:hypothetical protein